MVVFSAMSELVEDPVSFRSNAGDEDEVDLVMPALFEPGDLGVAAWKDWDYDRLCNHLGFLEGRPTLFEPWRPKSGLEECLDDVKEEDRDYFGLQWHQAAAGAAMTHGYWTMKPVVGGVPGMLLADTVGLGKTVEIIALIAMVVQTRQAEQQEAGVRSKILGE